MTVYRIAGWPEYFETAKSSEYVTPVKALSPNRLDGVSLAMILGMPEGLAIYGAFKLMVCVASKQPRPRDGWLTSDGTKTGMPYTAKTLALLFRRQESEIQRALNVLSAVEIQWLEVHDTAKTLTGPQQVPGSVSSLLSLALPSLALGTDSSEVRSTDSKPTVASEPHVAKPEPRKLSEPESPVVLSFPCVGSKSGQTEWHLREDQLAEYALAFPGLPVRNECQRALQWIRSSPRNRKTFNGYAKFLFTWMARTNDRGGGGGARPRGNTPELLRPEDVPV